MTTYAIPRSRFEKLDTTIAKLNKRALRLGVEPLHFEATYVLGRLLEGAPERVAFRAWESGEDWRLAFEAAAVIDRMRADHKHKRYTARLGVDCSPE